MVSAAKHSQSSNTSNQKQKLCLFDPLHTKPWIRLKCQIREQKKFFFVKNFVTKNGRKNFLLTNSFDWKMALNLYSWQVWSNNFSAKKSRASWTFLVKSFFVLKLFVPRFFSFVQRPFILLFVRLFSFPLIWKRNTTERGDGGALVLFSWWQQQQRQSINWKTF